MTTRPGKTRASRGVLAGPWIFLLAMTVAVVIVSHAVVPLDREALRLVVVPAWVNPAMGLVLAALLVVWVGGFLLLAARSPGDDARGPIRAIPIVLLLAMLVSMPFTSTDVFLYLAQASTWLDFADNPYVTSPSGNGANPFLPLSTWPHDPAQYGPLAVLVSGALYHAPLGGWGHLFLFRFVAGACLLGAFRIASGAAHRLGREDHRATALVLACPLLVLEVGSAAHNDSWIALLLLACVYALLRGWSGRALILLAASVWIKYTTLVLAPAIAVWIWRTRSRSGRGRAGLIAGALVALAGSAGLLALFGGPGIVLSGLTAASERSTRSIPWLLQAAERGVGGNGAVTLWTLRCLLLGILVVLAARVRDHTSLVRALIGSYLAFLFLGAAWFQPWYLIPLLPLSLLADDRSARTLVLGFSGSAVVGLYAVYFATYSFAPPQLTVMTLITFGPPVALAWRHRRSLVP